jgi:acyl carrier protein
VPDRREILEAMKAELETGRGVPKELVEENALLTQDLGLDSLDLVALRMELENRYGVHIPDEQLDAIVTVRDAIDSLLEQFNVGA